MRRWGKKMTDKRSRETAKISGWVLTALLTAFSAPLFAQEYPNRPLKMIIPWPAGQATDLAGRVVAQELSKELGQPVVAENKAGAGGTIGTDMGAKASPDGYTLTMGSSGPFTIVPLFQKTPYDPEKDFTPVAMVGLSPYNLVTAADFPAKNAAEFVALLKANPGKYTFASSGSGATAHLIAESFNAASGIKAVHVPYKGSVPALTDVAGGQVTYSIETAASTMPFIRNGRLKGYGVSLKDGSTVTPGQEPLAKVANIPGFDLGAWVGVLLPAGTPQPVIDRLSAAIAKIMKLPEVQKQFDTIAVQVDYRNQENFKKYLKSISQEFATVIKTNDIKVE
jgi:tripartite-type tricarboxylate transporter receptor subunit TctC